MTLEFIAAAKDYKQRWEAIKDFYRWRKYPEEKPERIEKEYLCTVYSQRSVLKYVVFPEGWLYWDSENGSWETSIDPDLWTNLPPIEDK
jgi:hypothetical protein